MIFFVRKENNFIYPHRGVFETLCTLHIEKKQTILFFSRGLYLKIMLRYKQML